MLFSFHTLATKPKHIDFSKISYSRSPTIMGPKVSKKGDFHSEAQPKNKTTDLQD